MKNRKTFIGIALIIAVLLIGIAYADITDLTLKISGSASATPSTENFKVRFSKDDTITTNGAGTITADLDSSDTTGQTATLTVTGLTAKGQKATAVYTVVNDSPDLSADLEVEVSKNTNSEYFTVTPTLGAENITATGDTEKTTVTVVVELIKTPIDADVSSDIEVTLTASPVQPTTGGTTE